MKPKTVERSFRANDAQALEVLVKLIPEEAQRRYIARIFAKSCIHAHVQSPSCWDLTLDRSFLRLNVGQVALLDVTRERLFLCAAPALPNLPDPARISRSRPYRAIPIKSVSVSLPLEVAGKLNDEVLAAHRRYIVEAANRKRVTPWKGAHSPAAVRVLSQWSDRAIPQPEYLKDTHDEPELSQKEIEGDVDDMVASKAVEEMAIQLVRNRYECQGWGVRSVEAEKVGFDLDCTKGKERRHVEVKGRARSGKVVLLTANEWRRAVEDPQFFIAVVSEIGSQSPLISEWSGAGFQDSHRIKPILFHACRRDDRDVTKSALSERANGKGRGKGGSN